MRKTNSSKLTTKITCITDLVDEDIKTALISILNMFKKLSGDMEGIKRSKSNVIK